LFLADLIFGASLSLLPDLGRNMLFEDESIWKSGLSVKGKPFGYITGGLSGAVADPALGLQHNYAIMIDLSAECKL